MLQYNVIIINIHPMILFALRQPALHAATRLFKIFGCNIEKLREGLRMNKSYTDIPTAVCLTIILNKAYTRI
jgi:hypothetical protein